VLTLHLKRFRTLAGRPSAKLDDHVPFPLTLDLAAYAPDDGRRHHPPLTHFSQLPLPRPSDGSCSYRLYGVVEHVGSFKGGHYVAYVRSDEHDCWHCFSDSRVTRVAESAVLASPAFLLFYERFSSA